MPLKILFDHNVDRRFRKHLPGHTIQTTRERGWEKLSNGILLLAAADAHFDLFVSIDKNLEFQQNLKSLPIAIVVIDSRSNALQSLLPFATPFLELLATSLDRMLYVLKDDGTTLRLDSPRA